MRGRTTLQIQSSRMFLFVIPPKLKLTNPANSPPKTLQFRHVLETLTRSTYLPLEPFLALRPTRRMQCFHLHLSAAISKTKGLSLCNAAPRFLRHSAQHDFVYRMALKVLKPKTGLHHTNSHTTLTRALHTRTSFVSTCVHAVCRGGIGEAL